MSEPSGARAQPPAQFTIRELDPADAERCQAFLQGLDPWDVKMRFGALHTNIHYFCPDGRSRNDRLAFAAIGADAAILGVLNLVQANDEAGGVAILVRSDCQRRGIGRTLLVHGCAWAEAHRLARLFGYVLAENKAMLALARALGCRLTRFDSFFIELSLDLAAPQP